MTLSPRERDGFPDGYIWIRGKWGFGWKIFIFSNNFIRFRAYFALISKIFSALGCTGNWHVRADKFSPSNNQSEIMHLHVRGYQSSLSHSISITQNSLNEFQESRSSSMIVLSKVHGPRTKARFSQISRAALNLGICQVIAGRCFILLKSAVSFFLIYARSDDRL